MRYDAGHKMETRKKVLREAAKAVRALGPDRVSVADVMASVGLTHGGFYAHFKSKDDLLAAAVDEMFIDAGALVDRSIAGLGPAEGLSDYIDNYLSARHRDARATGCPVAALAADLPRLSEPVRERYGRGVAGLVTRIGNLLAQLSLPNAEGLASSVAAELVGALSLARAVADPDQSDGLLAASRLALKRRLGLEIEP